MGILNLNVNRDNYNTIILHVNILKYQMFIALTYRVKIYVLNLICRAR